MPGTILSITHALKPKSVGLRDITVSKHKKKKQREIRRRVFDTTRFMHDLHALPKVIRFTDKQVTICVHTERADYGHPLN